MKGNREISQSLKEELVTLDFLHFLTLNLQTQQPKFLPSSRVAFFREKPPLSTDVDTNHNKLIHSLI